MQIKNRFNICFILFVIFLCNLSFASEKPIKPRIIITADPELDDNNSLIRFLLYSSNFKVEGLIYASSQFHWKGDGKGTTFMIPGREYTKFGLNLCPCTSYRWKQGERFIHEAVEAYEKVYPNLKIHDPAYPSPAYLFSKIRYGNINFEGDYSENTEGSDLIKAAILDQIPGHLYITAWGGESTIARALKSIEDENKNKPNWKQLKATISKKVVLLSSGHQDLTYVQYIRPNWPDIDCRQYQKGPNYSYGAQLNALKENAELLTPKWMQQQIRSVGPLGEIYRVWGDGKQMVKGDPFDYFGLDGYSNEELKKMGYIVWMPKQEKGSWLGEGDTGTFMNLLDNGLQAIETDAPGGWGGKPFHPNPKTYIDPFSNDTSKVKDLVISEEYLKKIAESEDNSVAFPNFFPAAQHDFAARMKWSVTNNFKSANHAPIIQLKGSATIQVKPGQQIYLNATVKEPDGDQYEVKWWQFSKKQTETVLGINQKNSLQTSVTIPANAKKQTLYLVLQVQEKNENSLTSYQLIKIII